MTELFLAKLPLLRYYLSRSIYHELAWNLVEGRHSTGYDIHLLKKENKKKLYLASDSKSN